MSEPDLKGRVRGARVAMYQEVILDAAEAVFAEHGYEGARVQSVAASAGISLATLYGVFAKKWDLYCAVHARRIRELMDYVLEGLPPPSGEPLGALLGGIGAYMRFHMERPTYLKMHLHGGLAWSLDQALRSEEQRQAWEAGLALMTSALRAAIEAGLVVDEDPVLLARTAVAMHQVRLAAWVDGGMEATPREVIAPTQAQFIRAFCEPERVPELLKFVAAENFNLG